MNKIGFIGMGIMGQGMASNIAARGFPLRVWNRTRAKMDIVIQKGALAADHPADLAEKTDIIIVCVSDEAAVEQVLFGSEGVATGVRPGSLIIDMSTISPRASRQNAAALAQKGFAMLDAPVSGSREGAIQGSLSIMVGGAEADYHHALPVFEAMGQNIVHVGSHCGDGQTVKLVNQLLAAGHTLIMSEALLFAQAGGVDLAKTLAAVEAGAAGSWMLTHRGPQVISRDWKPGFTIDLQLNSTANVLKAADNFGVPLPVTALLYQFYRTLKAQGLGQEGHHALIKALENLAGIKVGPVDKIQK
jgi:3-hydroxyisobutyrate dehydrogenase